MEDVPVQQLTVPIAELGKTTVIRNPNSRDVDVTVHLASGTSISFFVPSNGQFSFMSCGDVLEIDMHVRDEKTGPTSID